MLDLKISGGQVLDGTGAPAVWAAVVAFSPGRVADLVTYDDPHRYAAGIEHMVVNGCAVVRGGEHTGNLPGRVLRPAAG